MTVTVGSLSVIVFDTKSNNLSLWIVKKKKKGKIKAHSRFPDAEGIPFGVRLWDKDLMYKLFKSLCYFQMTWRDVVRHTSQRVKVSRVDGLTHYFHQDDCSFLNLTKVADLVCQDKTLRAQTKMLKKGLALQPWTPKVLIMQRTHDKMLVCVELKRLWVVITDKLGYTNTRSVWFLNIVLGIQISGTITRWANNGSNAAGSHTLLLKI